jgi:hypothetical protein
MRILSDPRLFDVQGVDLRGTSLGMSRGGREGGPSVLMYLTAHCKHIRRLLLQVSGSHMRLVPRILLSLDHHMRLSRRQQLILDTMCSHLTSVYLIHHQMGRYLNAAIFCVSECVLCLCER